MRKIFLTLPALFLFLAIAPQAWAALPSNTCFPAVECSSGEDYYADDCNPHIVSTNSTSPSCQSVFGAPASGKQWAFTCENGCYQSTIPVPSSCPGGITVSGNCLAKLNVVNDNVPVTGEEAYKIWDGSNLTEIVHVGTGCADGEVPIADNDGSSGTGWVCGTPSGGSLWTENGDDVYRSSGRVGIGTDTPAAQLEISSLGNAGIRIMADTNNAGGEDQNATLYLSQDDDAVHGLVAFEGNAGQTATDTLANALLFGTETAHPVQLISNDQAQVTLTSAGNMGIGTTAPDSKLHVVGDVSGALIKIDHTSPFGGGGIFLTTNASIGSTYGISVQNASSGGVGISASASASGGKGISLSGPSDGYALYTSGVSPSYFDGFVGIGDLSPDFPLTVEGDIDFNNNMLISAYGSSTNIDYIRHDDGSNIWYLQSDAPADGATDNYGGVSSGSAFMGINSTYGDSYAAFSHVNYRGAGEYALLQYYPDGHTYLNSVGTGNIYFRNDNNNLMTLTDTGDLGIGDTSPDAKLDVEGDVRLHSIYGEDSSNLVIESNGDGANNGYYIDLRPNDATYGVVIRQNEDTADYANLEVTDDYFGIGATQSGSDLRVYEDGKVDVVNGPDNNGTTASLVVGDGSNTLYMDGNEIDSDGSLYLQHNSNRNVYIDGGGRVGIGTTTLPASLTVLTPADNEAYYTGINSYSPLNGVGVVGRSDNNVGVQGTTTYGDGVLGSSTNGTGVEAQGGYLGISAGGDTAGGLFQSGTKYAYLAYSTYSLYGNASVRGVGAYINGSDIRLKKNVVTIDHALDKVMNLRGVEFEWKDTTLGEGKKYGFIAQEVEKVTPQLVIPPEDEDELVEGDEVGKYYGMEYGNVTALLTNAIQELKAEKDAEIAELKEVICELKPTAEVCDK